MTIRRVTVLCVAILIAVLFSAAHAFAATVIDTDIVADTQWSLSGSPYVVNGDLAVAPGSSLTIDPGVLVQFADDASLNFFGPLIAVGTESQPIVFTSLSVEPVVGNWSGLVFHDGTPLALSWIHIAYAQTAITQLAGTALVVDHFTCSFTNTCLSLIGANATVDSITIDHSSGELIGALGGSTVTITNASFSNLENVYVSDLVSSFVDSSVSISHLFVDGVPAISEGFTTFIDSSLSIDYGTFEHGFKTTGDALSGFSNSTLSVLNTNISGKGTGNGIEVYDGGTLNFSNGKITHFLSGVATYNTDQGSPSTLTLDHIIVSHNAVGVEVDGTPTLSVATASIHDNASGVVYNHADANTIAFTGTWWGDASGPYNATHNPEGLGNSVSDDISFLPFLIEDPFDEHEAPAQYYAKITALTAGYANVRENPNASATLIKTLPVDYVVRVISKTNSEGTEVIADGYRWFCIEDPSDGTTGWMIANPDTIETVTYLPYDELAQEDYTDIATTVLDTKEKRQHVIEESVEHYLGNTDTNRSLYSSDDTTGKEISDLAANGFTKELILAIIAQESGIVAFDNENVSYDYGHGIMQLTTNYNYNEIHYTYNKNKFEPLGEYSLMKNIICAGIGNDNYKKCYENTYDVPNLRKKSYDFYNHNSANPKYKQYTNTEQSIYANIKDGLGVLVEKQKTSFASTCKQGSYTVDGETFTCDDLRKIKTVWAYNGVDTTPSNHYLALVSQKLANLSIYFPGYSYDDSDHFIEKLAIADKHRREIKVHSPVTLQVKDLATGETTGLHNGEIVEDIDNSMYDPFTEGVLILFPESEYSYQLTGEENSSYGFEVVATDQSGEPQDIFSASNVPVQTGAIHKIILDESVLTSGGEGATIEIDNDADGVVDETITSGSVLDLEPPIIDLANLSNTYVLGDQLFISDLVSDNITADENLLVTATLGETAVSVLNGNITLNVVGEKLLTIHALDAAGNESVASKLLTVHYRFSGISYIPNHANNEYGTNATIAIGFILDGKNNVAIPLDQPGIDAVRISDGFHAALNSNSADDNGYCDVGEHCFTKVGPAYGFALKTATLSTGEWNIVITLGDGSTYTRPILIH
jgi:hypothetical protein